MTLFARHVETYDFYRGNRHWRVASSDRPVIVEGQTYAALRGLSRGRIVQSAEENKAALEVKVPADFELLDQFRPYPPTSRIHVNVKRIRISDGFVAQAWMGVIADVDDTDPASATIRCQTLMAAMSANGLPHVWQVPCGLPLYSVGHGMCNVDRELHRTPGTIASVAGTTITSAALAAHGDAWFSGGFVEFVTPQDLEYRFIVSQVGDTAVLLTPPPFGAGTAVSFFPGCDHSIPTCDSKFGNALNYGGQHTIPDKNAFGGDPVF